MRKNSKTLIWMVVFGLTILLTTKPATADVPDRTFRVIKTNSDNRSETDGPVVEVGTRVDVRLIVNAFRGMYRDATRSAEKPDGEELTWQIIHAANPDQVIPVCFVPQDGNMYLGRGKTAIWDTCPEAQRYIGLIAGPSGRIRIPLQFQETYEQKEQRLAQQEACLKDIKCLKEKLSKLEGKKTEDLKEEPKTVTETQEQPKSPPKDDEGLKTQITNLRAENDELAERPRWGSMVVAGVLILILGLGLGRYSRIFAVQPVKSDEHEVYDIEDAPTIPSISVDERSGYETQLARLTSQRQIDVDRIKVLEKDARDLENQVIQMGETNRLLICEKSELTRQLEELRATAPSNTNAERPGSKARFMPHVLPPPNPPPEKKRKSVKPPQPVADIEVRRLRTEIKSLKEQLAQKETELKSVQTQLTLVLQSEDELSHKNRQLQMDLDQVMSQLRGAILEKEEAVQQKLSALKRAEGNFKAWQEVCRELEELTHELDSTRAEVAQLRASA